MEKDIESTLAYFRLSEGTEELRRAFVQGNLFQLVIRHEKRWRPPPKKRSSVTRFTYQARLRLCKFVNTIDYDRTKNSLFMTFTYPDWNSPPDRYQRNQHRRDLMRAMEGIKKKPLSGIWRIEWMPRLSGRNVGLMMPHWHFILFDVGWLNYKRVRDAWRRILHEQHEPSMKFIGCRRGDKVTAYVSKYVAKVDLFSNLDNVAYLANHGRHWGMLRKAQIPRCTPRWTQPIADEAIDQIWRALAERFDWQDPSRPQSCAVFGKHKLAMMCYLAELGLTLEPVMVP